jgi:Kdo2-lipid IVA lauroyltransferase/acyltransferase
LRSYKRYKWLRPIIEARDWVIAQVVFLLMALLRLVPAKGAVNFSGNAARKIGPLLPRHRLGLENLRRAFPEKSEEECKKILLESWENLGRTTAEYVYLDKIFDLRKDSISPDRFDYYNEQEFFNLRDDGKPALIFAAHLANWELLPVCAATFGLNVQSLFRMPNNRFIAKKLSAMRGLVMEGLVASGPGAAYRLTGSLRDGEHVGILVDQKFLRGIVVPFFGQPAYTNPLLAKLLRSCDCPVHGARTIRLPDGRFRMEMTKEISIPRDSNGEVDVEATTAKITGIVEGWIREHPGQWLWFHKRWEGSRH